jgi:cytochrome c biogenesis protein CcdA
MTAKEITAIAIKFLAISLMISTVLHAPRLILAISAMEGMHNEKFESIFYIAVIGFFLILGFLSVFILYRVSNSILKSIPESNNDPVNISQAFILQVVGVYFIVSALQAFPSLSAYISPNFEAKKHLGYFVGYTFELAVGLHLLISPSVWVRLFNKLRGRV